MSMTRPPSTAPAPPRAVAIVGRPNVGKSALFNRLAGRRIAIVHDEPGVTRDRIATEARWDDQVFSLIDTGGLGLLSRARADDELAAAIERQVEAAIEEAAVVVMVVDVRTGPAPLDEEVADRLRRSGRPVVLAANKADRSADDAGAFEFERFGFPVIPVSAAHGRGMDELMEEVLARLSPASIAEDNLPALRIGIFGRPNAGKSSFINRLVGRERLVVSSIPGTTRDCVEVPLEVEGAAGRRRYLLVDTAGLRASGRLESAVERFSLARVESAMRRVDVAVLLFDGQVGPTRQDQRIARMILDEHRGCVLAVNKWDLAAGGLGPAAERRRRAEYRAALRREFPFLDFAPLLFVSARTGSGMDEAPRSFELVARNVSARLPTGLLNRLLREAFERQSPPSIRGRRLKLLYATQTGERPLRVRLFVNDPDLLTPAYANYLEGRLRAALGLEGAPLVFQAESRPRRDAATHG